MSNSRPSTKASAATLPCPTQAPDGIHIDDWKRELDALAHSNDAEYAKYKRLRAELSELLDVKYCIDRALDARAEGRKMRPLSEERG